MADKDMFAERGRSLEEDYFRKKDKELIEKMRASAAAARTRTDMGQKTGITDPELLQQLEALGFTIETVALLPLVPLVQVAWAEGGVTPAERNLIVRIARARGIDEGTAADHQLAHWLESRPREEVFSHAMRLIRAMLDAPGGSDLTADELARHAESIAAASGGVFGFKRVTAEERELLSTLAAELKGR
jgi:hypothetical protein